MKRSFSLALSLLALATLALTFAFEAQALICAPGDKAEVLWKGRWYPATVRRAKGNSCYIHYDGYNNSWDEWVGPGRIRVLGGSPATAVVAPGYFQVGDPVSVLWGDKWWPARVLKKKGDRLYIHYDGYGNNWNEWVGPNRYRAP